MKKLAAIFILNLLFHAGIAAGNGFSVRLSTDYGFTSKTVELTDHEVSNIRSIGCSGSVNYQHSIYFPNTFWLAGMGVSYHYLTAETTTSKLAGAVVDPFATIGFGYDFLQRSTVLFNLKASPNRLWDDFRNETTDLLRYNLEGIYSWKVNNSWRAIIGFHGLIYPRVDIYRINNPSYAASIGVQYNFKR